mmetsp:Transcript_2202/g.5806  ORF Transcript_2202/g.5806 Transcript_2202/m.5806 type:complete len:353 (+) Transcript_2202:334-1392(+)
MDHAVFDAKSKLYIVMELVTGGELLDRLAEKDHYSEMEAANVFHQMTLAVEYLHSIGIVHRDLKPLNILYAHPGPDSPIKVADFGLGKMLDVHHTNDIEHAMHTICGTPEFVAPEVIAKTGYGPEVDVWSLGVLLYMILSGDLPFQGEMPQLFSIVMKGEFSMEGPAWVEISDDAKDLIRRLLAVDPSHRLTPTQALADVWVQRFVSGSLPAKKLQFAQEKLREWNAVRKLKGAISAAVAIDRLIDPAGPGLSRLRMDADERKQVLERLHKDREVEEELKESFDILDVDHKGRLDAHALIEGLHAFGADPEVSNSVRVFTMFSPASAHDGYIFSSSLLILFRVFFRTFFPVL